MAEFPALPLFTDAYLADTRHLTTIQHGAYLLMLMTAWRSTGCHLKNDDAYLCRITGIDPRHWHHHKEALLSFWRFDEAGYLTQNRLLDERKYVEVKRNQQSAAGKASALKRLNRGSTNVEIRSNENSTPTPTPIEERKKEPTVLSKEKRATRLPDNFEPDESCHQLAEKLLLTNQESQGALDNFMDYWRAVPGAKGLKLDWQMTFKNQLRHVAKQKVKPHGKTTRADAFAILDTVTDEAIRREGRGTDSDETNIVELSGLRKSAT